MPLIQRIILPRIVDDGLLFETRNKIPFPVRRVYYITSPKSGLARGKHAHKKNRQVLFCLQGKVKLVLDNGRIRRQITLKRPEEGIFLDTMVWHEMLDMNEKTILLVLASRIFEPDDYIRNYRDFKKLVHDRKD